MALPQPEARVYSHLLTEIEKGSIKIPQFQRDFVWSLQKSVNLLDSIIKGYPIGTFIFWKTKERLRSVRNIGGKDLPESPEGDYVYYVLDGQQRLTSLFASIKGLEVERGNGYKEDFSKIYIDLEAKDDEQIIISECSGKSPEKLVKLCDLLKGGFKIYKNYSEEYHEKLDDYRLRIQNYQFSIISIADVGIDIATEIFTRINVGAQPLSLFEIMVAKTYDYDRNFDLAEKYEQLIERLKTVNYETISDATVLQCMAACICKECTRKIILKLDKTEFVDTWKRCMSALESAVEYFKNTYRIPVSQLLPYNALLVPFTYFFFHHPDKPDSPMASYLEDYFWRCSLSGRFSSSVETKLGQDIKRIDDILQGKQPSYDWSIDISEQSILENGRFSAGRSYIKAILCIYAYQLPKSFQDDSLVNISNYWLKQANSKNYHHFFPKSFLEKQGEDWHRINHIANITIVDDYLNKRIIGAQPPSIYMKKFIQNNSNIKKTMESHLIDLDDSVLNDDFDQFFRKRISKIHTELKKRIINQVSDKDLTILSLPSFDEETE